MERHQNPAYVQELAILMPISSNTDENAAFSKPYPPFLRVGGMDFQAHLYGTLVSWLSSSCSGLDLGVVVPLNAVETTMPTGRTLSNPLNYHIVSACHYNRRYLIAHKSGDGDTVNNFQKAQFARLRTWQAICRGGPCKCSFGNKSWIVSMPR